MTTSRAGKPQAEGAGFAQKRPLVQTMRRMAEGFLRLVYPPQCLGCEAIVDQPHSLCPTCWGATPLITGLVCDGCGLPLPGQEEAGMVVQCDDCLRHPPPWQQGRAALLYDEGAKPLILRLKHGDRLDLSKPLGDWLYRAAQPLLTPQTLLVPIPLHRWRLARRRYNQSALLAARVAARSGLPHIPDLLLRRRATPSQEGRSRAERQENLMGAFALNPRHQGQLSGKPVLIIDDVMTSGATLREATRVLSAEGAGPISVATLARVPPHFLLRPPSQDREA